jgi:hypothetical protein
VRYFELERFVAASSPRFNFWTAQITDFACWRPRFAQPFTSLLLKELKLKFSGRCLNKNFFYLNLKFCEDYCVTHRRKEGRVKSLC